VGARADPRQLHLGARALGMELPPAEFAAAEYRLRLAPRQQTQQFSRRAAAATCGSDSDSAVDSEEAEGAASEGSDGDSDDDGGEGLCRPTLRTRL